MTRARMTRFCSLTLAATLATAASIAGSSPGLAAGYDTPMLYSARHMGMGGAAIGWVDEPSAIFHNPAGLSRIGFGAMTLDVSPATGKIKARPHASLDSSVTSNPAMAPFFLAAAAFQVHDRVHVGFGVYPVASAGADFEYKTQKTTYKAGKKVVLDVDWFDYTKLAFIEAAPAVSVRLLDGLSLGIAWRPAYVTFDRQKFKTTEGEAQEKDLDLAMSGVGFSGVRIGLQYEIGDFEFGAVYRNGTTVEVKAAEAIAFGGTATDGVFSFTLPTKFGAGMSWTGIPNLRLVLDGEYTLNSENEKGYLAGNLAGTAVELPSHYFWQDSFTVRTGAAYDLTPSWTCRAGYAFDSQATNKSYPSAFGTPPAFTQIGTVGGGWRVSDAMEVNLALAWRHGAATVSDADIEKQKTIDAKEPTCQFCGQSGDYVIDLYALYIDFTWRFGEIHKDNKLRSAAQ